jgi:hypothetical protein
VVFQIVYVSRTDRDWPHEDLVRLLARARRRNQEQGVTGMLLYRRQAFLQLLEADRPGPVQRLYRSIRADSRHRDVTTVWAGGGGSRRFPDWTMGFADASGRLQGRPGFTSFLDSSVNLADLNGTVVDQLLAYFGPANHVGGRRPQQPSPRPTGRPAKPSVAAADETGASAAVPRPAGRRSRLRLVPGRGRGWLRPVDPPGPQ